MGLEQVVSEVRRAANEEAAAIRAEAQKDAQLILDEAHAHVATYTTKEHDRASKLAEQERIRIQSSAEFAGRKVVLQQESALRDQLMHLLVDGFGRFDADVRKGHVEAMLAAAGKHIEVAKVWTTSADQSYVSADLHAGTFDGAGGIIAETADGSNRIDLRYETLLRDAWRDILKQESALFA